ncbi:MAG: YbaB/EbfC family nucleoid-associated protein [Fibrobacter sp.]|nr:YbaB/EbfC family nucleoid-associated protein [Fibrobacter sp.]
MSKNINKLLKQAQKVQAQVMKAQEEMQKKEFEGTSGGGMVKVMLNGANELVSIKINPEVVDRDEIEMLEDLIIAAHSNAQEKIKETSDSTMGSITSGLNIPGL